MGTPFTVASSCWRSCSAPASHSTPTSRRARSARRRPRRRADRHARARASSRSATCASRRCPSPQEVSPAQAQREGLEDLDRSYPPARRHADEEVLKLLGLLEPDVDLREVSATIFGQGVAGYYDPRTKRLRIVKGAQTANRVLNEITLAHELTHALEDQRFGLDLEDASGSDDAALAHLALVEGSATAVMFTYAERHFSAEQTLGGLLSSLGPGHRRPAAVHRGAAGLPLHSRARVRRSGSTSRAAAAGRWSTPPTASARRPRPSRSCTPTSTCRSSSPSACAARRAQGPARAGGGSRPARGASGRPASCSTTRRRRGLGRRPLRAVAARQRRLQRARAATATRSSCAGAGTRAADAREFEAALREWLARAARGRARDQLTRP